jgi:PAS domain S-box-containing protein
MSGSAGNPGSQREAAVLSWIQQFAPYGVLTLDEAFRVQSWNHWMELYSGMRLEQVLGKTLFSLFPDLQERKLVPHFERALEGASSVLSTALHRYLLPLPSPYRDQGLTHMLQTARIAPLFAQEKVCGIVVVIEDVTQRESQADALGRQHRRDELLSWALAHLLKTEAPRKAVRQLFFKIAEQLEFDTFLLYLRDHETGHLHLEEVGGVPEESDKDFFDCPFNVAFSAESNELLVLNSVQTLNAPQYRALQKVGVTAAVVMPLMANGWSLGLLCFATCVRDTIEAQETDLLTTIAQYLATALDRDNTNRQLQKAKSELSEHAQLLERKVHERTARLEEIISELETFSYTIAHDLRAPARSMVGYCEVMLEDFSQGLAAPARKVIEKIARASGRMESLTRDLLEFSRISRQEIVLSPVEIEPIVEDVMALRPSYVKQAITTRGPLHRVRAHRGLLQHVLGNLLDNAVKFVRPDASPKITISSEVVERPSPSTRPQSLIFSSTESAPERPTPESDNGQVRIWVRDEGIGIPREAHGKIFGIFERGTSSDLYEGTGIGLAIVARAMQRMGGTCGVESEPEKGSQFWIELPAA